MELPDVKVEAHKQIDSLKGAVLGMVQIMADDKGHMAICIGGIPDVIINILSKAMQDNHQIKDLFEAAYCKSMDPGFNPSIN